MSQGWDVSMGTNGGSGKKKKSFWWWLGMTVAVCLWLVWGLTIGRLAWDISDWLAAGISMAWGRI